MFGLDGIEVAGGSRVVGHRRTFFHESRAEIVALAQAHPADQGVAIVSEGSEARMSACPKEWQLYLDSKEGGRGLAV
jgi:hypothetical protein